MKSMASRSRLISWQRIARSKTASLHLAYDTKKELNNPVAR
jgi:hypothetical protein